MVNSSMRQLLKIPTVFKLETSVTTIKEMHDYLEYFELIPGMKKFMANTDQIIPSSGRLGFELEMEGVPDLPKAPPLWEYHGDQSLRNHGTEMVSCPLPAEFIKPALYLLRQFLQKIAKKKPDFSWRTSNHIHCNVQDLSIQRFLFQLRLYLVFEPLLYFFAGQDRSISNFCVPLKDSTVDIPLSQMFQTEAFILRDLGKFWPKYAGLSIFRLGDYGTIEYRHLPGTGNISRLIMWSNLILSLYNSSQSFYI